MRRRITIGLLIVAASGLGCNPILFPFYIFGGLNNPKFSPSYEFYKNAKKDKDRKDIKIVILPERGRGLSPDFFGQEREFASTFAKKLEQAFEDNKERVKIVPIKDVEAYKSSHPDWKSMPPHEIGKHFQADYVFALEMGQLALFEPKSYGQFLRGSCRISLAIVDVEKDEPVQRWDMSPQYPKDGKTQMVDMDNNVEKFRQEFFNRVASRLVRHVTAAATPEHLDID